MNRVRRAPLLRAEQSLLEPLPPSGVRDHASHVRATPRTVGSRCQSDDPEHLRPSLARHRTWVNETSSRCPVTHMPMSHRNLETYGRDQSTSVASALKRTASSVKSLPRW